MGITQNILGGLLEQIKGGQVKEGHSGGPFSHPPMLKKRKNEMLIL